MSFQFLRQLFLGCRGISQLTH
uniref:Uncharacterized protein n=1 Tax=Arundo donax TaxID=35708 RepID=A0A0A8ZF66_ARUDO